MTCRCCLTCVCHGSTGFSFLFQVCCDLGGGDVGLGMCVLHFPSQGAQGTVACNVLTKESKLAWDYSVVTCCCLKVWSLSSHPDLPWRSTSLIIRRAYSLVTELIRPYIPGSSNTMQGKGLTQAWPIVAPSRVEEVEATERALLTLAIKNPAHYSFSQVWFFNGHLSETKYLVVEVKCNANSSNSEFPLLCTSLLVIAN